MKRYRIGKDVANRLRVRTNGEYTPLADRDISLQMTDPKGFKKWENFTILEDGRMLFTYYGKDQKYTGTYQLTVWENYGKVGQTAVDCVEAFRLVANTNLEGGEDPEGLDTEVNDLEFDIQTGIGGADGVGVASIEQTTTSSEDGGINEITATLTNGVTSTFQIRNGQKGSTGDRGEKGDAGADWIPTQQELNSIAQNTAQYVEVPDDLADLNDDSTHRLVTDTEKAAWNAKGTYSKPSGGIPKTDLASSVQTSLGKADTALQSYTETDPTVPSWAKQSSKPTYTASEVGALPASTSIPTKTSDLTNDSHFVVSTAITNIVSMTQAQYDALATKDSNTLYVII